MVTVRLMLSVLVLYVAVQTVVESCSCSPMTHKQKYCKSDVTIKGKVTGIKSFPRNPFDQQLRYKVRVLAFKGEVKKVINVFTAPHSAGCGISWLLKNRVYIFTLKKVTNSKYKINLCQSWVEQWSGLTDTEILGVNKYWFCLNPILINPIKVLAPAK